MALPASNERFKANGSYHADFRTILVFQLFASRYD